MKTHKLKYENLDHFMAKYGKLTSLKDNASKANFYNGGCKFFKEFTIQSDSGIDEGDLIELIILEETTKSTTTILTKLYFDVIDNDDFTLRMRMDDFKTKIEII